jgi:KUP system potassium uptake protein
MTVKAGVLALPIALGAIALIALFGATALHGDGVITPAISVISAMEGLEVWTSGAKPFVVPGAIALLVGLFVLQSRGTDRIARFFGPVMLLWFAAIALAGAAAIVQHPVVLAALNPPYAAHYLAHAPESISNAFYALFPGPWLIPMVVLSTAATIIASQSLITGVFSLTHQATELGLWPRTHEIHTSRKEIGQIYLPAVNVLLGVSCVTIVATFRSSAALGGGYTLAVSLTMLATTIAYATLTRTRNHWALWYRIHIIGLFLSWDVPFVLANLTKVSDGAWLPLLIACVLFVLSVTWDRGRSRRIASHRIVASDPFVVKFGPTLTPTSAAALNAGGGCARPTNLPRYRDRPEGCSRCSRRARRRRRSRSSPAAS